MKTVGMYAVPVVIVALILAPLAKDWTLRKIGFRLLWLGCLMSSWNAVIFHGIRPTDAILVLVLIILLIDSITHAQARGLPRLMIAGAVMIVLAGLAVELQPPSAAYLASRLNFVSARTTFGGVSARDSNLSELGKFEVALIAVPLVIVLLRPAVRELRQLSTAFLASVLVSSLIAITDQSGLTHISRKLIGFESGSDRQAGLTLHSNYLAASCALAMPVAVMWLTSQTKRQRSAGLAAIALMLVADLFTGSRGGAVGVALALAVSLVVLRGARWLLVTGAVIVPVVLVAMYNQLTTALQYVLTRTRFDNSQSAQVSSASRAALRSQAFSDFAYHPFQGIGYNVIGQAQEVHLGLLASGGMIALVGWGVYMTGAILQLRPARRADLVLAQAMSVTILAWLVLNFAENQVTDRFLYIPVGIVVALAQIARAADKSVPAGPDVAVSTAAPNGATAPGRAPALNGAPVAVRRTSIPAKTRAGVTIARADRPA